MLAISCFNNDDQKVIASVYEKDLLLSEVIKEMPQTTEDSTFFVERYMNLWIRKQLMIYHAEINLSSDLLDYEKQITEYRSSLLIYAYQQELIKQNFDTVVICFDQDKAGEEAARKVASIIKPGKAKIISLPTGFKDANEMLRKNQIREFTRVWWDAKLFTPSGIIRVSEKEDDFFNREVLQSVPYPYDGLNKKLYGLRQ